MFLYLKFMTDPAMQVQFPLSTQPVICNGWYAMSPILHIVFAFDLGVDLVRLLFLQRRSYYCRYDECKLLLHAPIQRNYKLLEICKS